MKKSHLITSLILLALAIGVFIYRYPTLKELETPKYELPDEQEYVTGRGTAQPPVEAGHDKG